MNHPSKTCPYCESQVSPAARFCSSCGRPVVVSENDQTIVIPRRPSASAYSPPVQPSPPPASPQKRRRPWLPLLAITLAVIYCLGVFGVGGLLGLRGGWTLPGRATTAPAEFDLELLLSETLQPSDQSQTV